MLNTKLRIVEDTHRKFPYTYDEAEKAAAEIRRHFRVITERYVWCATELL